MIWALMILQLYFSRICHSEFSLFFVCLYVCKFVYVCVFVVYVMAYQMRTIKQLKI